MEQIKISNYTLTKKIMTHDFTETYEALDENNQEVYILRFINFDQDINSENFSKFTKNTEFLFNIKSSYLPEIIEILTPKILIFKKYISFPIEEKYNYSEAYEILKNLFLSIDIASRNQVYFNLFEAVYFDKNKNPRIGLPFDLRVNKEYMIYQMAVIYESLLNANAPLPIELSELLENVKSQNIRFTNISDFLNALKDSITFGTIETPPVISKKIFYISDFFILSSVVLIMLFATFFLISVPLLKIVNSREESRIAEESISEDFFYKNNSSIGMEYLDEFPDNSLIDDSKDSIYYNVSDGENYILCKENKETSKVEIISKDLNLNFLTEYDDKLYFSNLDDNYSLYEIDTDGNNLKKLTNFPTEYLIKDPEKHGLHFVSNQEDNTAIIGFYDLETEENFISSDNYYDIYMLIKMYDVFREGSINKRTDLSFVFDNYTSSCIREYKDLLMYLETSDYETYSIKTVDYAGNYKLFPYNIEAYDFEVKNDIIYFSDPISGDLKSFNLLTREEIILTDDCFSILKLVDDYIFIYDRDFENILKLKLSNDRKEIENTIIYPLMEEELIS